MEAALYYTATRHRIPRLES